jgi:hypothetical protein
MMNWHATFGIASGLVLLLGNVPYILSIRRGDTRPSRVTWGIWTIIGLILLWSSYISGATNTLWLLASLVISQSLITFYAFKYGQGKWQQLDKFCLAGAGLSLLLWLVSGSPLVALLMNTTMDMLGAVPTIRKVYRDPSSEDLVFWLMSFTSALLNLFAIEQLSLSFVIFPTYLFILNITMLLLITRPKWSRVKTFTRKTKAEKSNFSKTSGKNELSTEPTSSLQREMSSNNEITSNQKPTPVASTPEAGVIYWQQLAREQQQVILEQRKVIEKLKEAAKNSGRKN